MSIGSIIGTTALFDKFNQSEEQISQLKNEIDLMNAQLEDKKHENIVTKIKNARLMLDYCDIPISEKNEILQKLSQGIKEATLLGNYDNAKNEFDSVVNNLVKCEVYPQYYENKSSTNIESQSTEIVRDYDADGIVD